MAYDWAAGLGGLGAALQGNYPQWEVAQSDRMKTLSELDDKRKQAMLEDFRSTLVRLKAGDTGGASQLLQDRLEAINQLGGDPTHTAEINRMIQEGRIDEAVSGLQQLDDMAVANGALPSMVLGGEGTPSNVQEFMFWQSLPPEQQQQYMQVKRAQQIIDMGGGASGIVQGSQAIPITQAPGQTIGQVRADVAGAEAGLEGAKSAAGEYGKLGAQLEVAPAIAGATTAAELGAQASIKPKMEADIARAVDLAKSGVLAAAQQKDAGKLFTAYDVAMQNLNSALGATETGPLAGQLPALTSNAQAASGAQQVLAVAIKGLVRTAGEGVWTDKDQQMIVDMMPTRKDTPEARAKKLIYIDGYIRAKLGQAPAEQSAPNSDIPTVQAPAAGPKFLGFE
jgi:hypothetical protein